MQLNMPLTTPTATKNAWAFAVDITRKQRTFQARKKSRALMASGRELNACIISAVSREARDLGVRVGMKYTEAVALIPDLRIIICNR